MFQIQDVTTYPASVMQMMPTYSEIPEEFKRWDNKWAVLVETWFFEGLKNLDFTPKEGVDPEKAFAHLSCLVRSAEPKHQHKIAAVAYLMSQWFDDVQYEAG